MKKIIHIILASASLYSLFIVQNALASKDQHPSVLTINAGDKSLKLSGYFDTYYAYDFKNPIDGQKDISQGGGRDYTSNPLYDRQLSVDYAFLQADFNIDKVSMRVAYHLGDIVQKMYINEPDGIKPIREASGKVDITDKLTVELGIMPSIFGFETFINKENMHATRAHMTDFAPDFDAGVRFYYNLMPNHLLKFQVTNGWQVIRDNNKDSALGLAYVYDVPGKVMFNWGQFFGNEAASGSKHEYRYYHNLFSYP